MNTSKVVATVVAMRQYVFYTVYFTPAEMTGDGMPRELYISTDHSKYASVHTHNYPAIDTSTGHIVVYVHGARLIQNQRMVSLEMGTWERSFLSALKIVRGLNIVNGDDPERGIDSICHKCCQQAGQCAVFFVGGSVC